MAKVNLEEKKQQSEIRQITADAGAKRGGVIVDKVNALTDVLSRAFVMEQDGNLTISPILNENEARIVRSKLIELVKKM